METTTPPANRLPGISILYFSGVGGTRTVANALGALLRDGSACGVWSIHDDGARTAAESSDFLVFCYPTYFLRPAPAMLEFIRSLRPSPSLRRAFLLTTYELYPENSNRACAIELRAKGIDVVGTAAVRAPGTDVTCLLPSRVSPWLYRFERNLPEKLASLAVDIRNRSRESQAPARIPARKWYTPLAQLLQVLLLNRFESWTRHIRRLPDRCSLCGECVRQCHRNAWRFDEGGLSHRPELCDLCTRCIHRCPQKAIVLVEALKDNRRLDGPLYASLESELALGLAEARGRPWTR